MIGAGGVRSALFGGEGLFFARLRGPGSVWIQSLPFARLAGRMLAASGSRGGQNRGEGSVLGGLGNLLDGNCRRERGTMFRRNSLPAMNTRLPIGAATGLLLLLASACNSPGNKSAAGNATPGNDALPVPISNDANVADNVTAAALPLHERDAGRRRTRRRARHCAGHVRAVRSGPAACPQRSGHRQADRARPAGL